jgi:diacylglycerol kinase
MDANEHNHKPAGQEKKDVLITPEGEEIDLSVTGTMNLKPEGRSPMTNKDRIASTKYAIAGLLYVLKHEQSIQIFTVITLVVLALAVWLEIGIFNWMFLIIAIGAVWVTECLNTAIEATINLTSPEPHPLAKIGKDVASAGTLAATVTFGVIVLIIIAPRLIERLT